MNSLSLSAINVLSSYEVSAVNDGCYQFFTDQSQLSRLTGISYGVIQRINSKMKLGQ